MHLFFIFLTLFLHSLTGEEVTLPEELKVGEDVTDSRFYDEFIHMLIMLGLLVTLLYLGAWFVRRMLNVRIDQVNESSEIKLLERRMITNKSAIYLLDVHGEKIIVAESVNGITKLGDLKEKPLPELNPEL